MGKSPARRLDWLSAFLLFLLVQVAAARLITTDWAAYLYFTEPLAAFGFALGVALGASRFGRRAVALLAISYTAALVPWQLTRAVTDKLALAKLTHVGRILLLSLGQFFRGQAVRDSLFFVLFVCLVFWLLSLMAGYWLARRVSVLASIVLGGAVIISVQAYANYQARGSWWLAVYLLLALLLAGRNHFLGSRQSWSQQRVFTTEEAGAEVFGSLFMTVCLAILLAWVVPTSAASLQTAAETWNSLTRPILDRLSNAVTSLNGPYGKAGEDFYGSTLAVGQDAAKGESIVFTVDILQASSSTVRYYWRGRAYSDYGEGGWSNGLTSNLGFLPDHGDLNIPDAESRSSASLRFTSQFPTQSLLYGPAPVTWVNRSAGVAAVVTDTGLYDALSWESSAALWKGGSYEVKAELTNPTALQARAAGTEYPAWITEHYLAVPTKYEADLHELASRITAGKENPYDRATAITDYLRANLIYETNVPKPPEGQDPVMWVLFDYHKGFCNYYASAEVLLLRSIGIPARLAVGFAEGERVGDRYTIRTRDAHAWPEVYFPGIGWLEFEPTSNQGPLDRPSGLPESSSGAVSRPAARPLEGPDGRQAAEAEPAPRERVPGFAETSAGRVLRIVVPGLALGLLVYGGYRYRAMRRLSRYLLKALESGGAAAPAWVQNWAHWNELESIERSFAAVNWSLRWLGKPASIGATPAERARALTNLLPAASGQIETLKFELESGLFTPRPADMPRARRASLLLLAHVARAAMLRLVGAD